MTWAVPPSQVPSGSCQHYNCTLTRGLMKPPPVSKPTSMFRAQAARRSTWSPEGLSPLWMPARGYTHFLNEIMLTPATWAQLLPCNMEMMHSAMCTHAVCTMSAVTIPLGLPKVLPCLYQGCITPNIYLMATWRCHQVLFLTFSSTSRHWCLSRTMRTYWMLELDFWVICSPNCLLLISHRTHV